MAIKIIINVFTFYSIERIVVKFYQILQEPTVINVILCFTVYVDLRSQEFSGNWHYVSMDRFD